MDATARGGARLLLHALLTFVKKGAFDNKRAFYFYVDVNSRRIHCVGGRGTKGLLGGGAYLDAMKGVMSNSRGKETYVVIFLRSLAECSNRWGWPEREDESEREGGSGRCGG